MRVEVPEHIEAAEDLGRVHFVGVGGAALSGLARIMAARGVTVSGSDRADSSILRSLEELGVRCWVGHEAQHVEGADTVVVSTAVPEDNPEVVRARELRLRLWPRSAAVQSVLVGRRSVVVTGTHGKTTTTSMLASALLATGADPSYAIGSTLNASGLNAADGSGDIFVVEGDESDGAILTYTPVGAVVTNVDVDHLDHFGSPAAYAAVFAEFLTRIQPAGFLVGCVDDPGAASLVDLARRRDLTVVQAGFGVHCDVRAVDVRFSGAGSSFGIWRAGAFLGVVEIQVPGRHYVIDAVAAMAAGLQLGFDFGPLAAGLESFVGTGRRMELKGTRNGVRVYDSYAHHPVEIAADLEAARAIAGVGRLVVCFQPHLFSRTKQFAAQMGEALGAADEVVVMDVYASREDKDPSVSGASVADWVPLPAASVEFVPEWSAAAPAVARRASPGDVVLTLGAGDVTRVAPLVMDLLGTQGERPS
ncbi:MAG: UDP-N-acetylmuramate--L-alanine ligase [Actinomycetota bacterium]|nr:UDP-N-acetylmuramate--L-alanine ligase [Actinomycetota bacterium]